MSKEEQEEKRKAEEEAARKAEEETSQEEESEEEELSSEELKARLAEKERRLREVNAESKERRLALEKLEKEKKEREEAELSEKERLEKRAAEAEKSIDALRQENRSLKLSQEFDKTARSLKLEFVNDKAREDVFRLLDPEKLGEKFENLEDEIKEIAKDRPYFFGKADPNQFINDGSRKGQITKRTVTRNIINKKRSRIAPL